MKMALLTSSPPGFRSARKRSYSIAATAVLLFLTAPVTGAETSSAAAGTAHSNDPHYTAAGFFDIHVCNWPDRELFFMPLFSTTRYSEITAIEVRHPDGKRLTALDLGKFMVLKPEGKPEKHVFMTQMDVPDGAADGWYSATIRLADGTQFIAKDFVVIEPLARPSGMNPPDGAEAIAVPEKLTWSAVAPGSYYQVFIRDVWNDGKLIYKSKLLREPQLAVPAGLLKPDGLYSWQIHARDTNEDVMLGDFNKGSMSRIATFSTAAD
jgi:hypothetical protein